MEWLSDVMRMCCEVSADRQMKAAVRNSGIGALVAGGGALIAGVLFGPPGIAAGGTLGGILGWQMTRGKFKPVSQILMELPTEQQKKLCREVKAVLGSLSWKDAVQLIAMVMNNSKMKKHVLDAIHTFLTKELNGEVQYGD